MIIVDVDDLIMAEKDLKYSSLTGRIIKLFYDSYNKYGYGFDHNIYKNSFAAAIRNSAVQFEEDKIIDIFYEVDIIGQLTLDFVVEQKVIVLIGSSEQILEKDLKRLYNYLKVSEYDTGLLLNYGINPEHRRRDLSKNSEL